MRFDIITLFPEIFDALDYGIIGRARQREIFSAHYWNPRNYTQDKTGRVDDRPYGGGPGMLMQVQPLRAAITAAKSACHARQVKPKILYLSPQGRPVKQADIQRFSQEAGFILVAGRYEGIDERVLTHDIDEEWSLGDYILSGGEFAALALIDAIVRLLPMALGDPESATDESFTFGNGLLDCPHYTRPPEIDGQCVPEVLLGGDHAAIRRFRLQQALGQTWQKRPDLLAGRNLSAEETELLAEFIKNQ